MNLQQSPFDFSSVIGWDTDAILFKNNDNLKPDWVQHPAENTEFYIRRNRSNLLVVIGESWTYGESLPDIATGLQRYNFKSQLMNSFGPKLALALDTDYYQYAVPGNCNGYMFEELSRILEFISSKQYQNVYLCMQLTEPGRELAVIHKFKEHPLHDLYFSKEKIMFDDWLSKYDEIFLDILDAEVSKYNNIKPLVWKNFCCFVNNKQYQRLNLVSNSWIKLSSIMLGKDLAMQKFQSVGWLYELKKFTRIKFDNKMLEHQLDLIEQSNKFINANPLHNSHPNLQGHTLWAYHLLRESGWKHV